MTWLLAAVGGVLAGVVTAGAVSSGVARQRAGWQEVSAVVVKRAADQEPAQAVGTRQAWATVRWRA
ncbi:hypothetical protein [Streptomyces carpinensis]|uniref:Secreted protein n=1 Tax=Streptomyces carpinensis TaxID=66369 RepID=A0ABV1W110_9ACTN|nr:hypothetical protein [Streptomyces carpinensis]